MDEVFYLNMPKTSVIIPFYNAEQYLAPCIESVLRCGAADCEILLADDGSEDGSANIAAEYAAAYPRVRFLPGMHRRQGDARNRAIREAGGEYLLFLDADDLLREEAAARCYALASAHALDVLTFDAEDFFDGIQEGADGTEEGPFRERSAFIPDNTVMSGTDFWTRYHGRGGVYYSAPLHYVNREFLLAHGLFFTPGIIYEDNDWTLRLYLAAGRIMYCAEPLYRRRCHPGQTTRMPGGGYELFSCLRIHQILESLCDQTAGAERNMVFNAADENIRRIRSAVFSPEAQAALSAFLDTQEAAFGAAEEDIFDMHMIFLHALAEGLQRTARPGAAALLERVTALSGKCACAQYLLSDEERTVAVCGAGIICSRFLVWYERTAGPIRAETRFFVTGPEENTFYGRPLLAMSDPALREADVVIIAVSAKNADALYGQARAAVNHGQRIVRIHPMLFEQTFSYKQEPKQWKN